MKEKIQLLSHGVFEYKKPVVTVSTDKLDINITGLSDLTGELTIASDNGIEIRALLFSSSKWLSLSTDSFIGTSGSVKYEIDIASFDIGERASGSIIILSNGGEIEIPCNIKISAPFCRTSAGLINELDEFTDLAKEDWNEALSIFRSEEFEKVFLHQNRYKKIYESLIKGKNTSLAMEEFLCAVRRKKQVRISISQTIIEIDDSGEGLQGKLLIERENWGYVNINVKTEGSFLTVYKKRLHEDDFLGSYCELEYSVSSIEGKNSHGAIIFESIDQLIEIPVIVHKERSRSEEEEERRSLKAHVRDLLRNYYEYSIGRRSMARLQIDGMEAVNGCLNNGGGDIYKVAEAHLLFLAGDAPGAAEAISGINSRELRYTSVVYYAYYLYVNAHIRDEEGYTDYVYETLEFYAKGQYDDKWELWYFLNHLPSAGLRGSGNHGRTERYYDHLKDIAGRQKPVSSGLISEMIVLVNQDPSLISEPGEIERFLFTWGVRHDCLDTGVVLRMADIFQRSKEYSYLCMKGLMFYYDKYQTRELLYDVIRQLILGKHTEPEYNRWYLQGIESSLKISEMYENYMLSLDRPQVLYIPTGVLVYYQYDNRLEDEKKALLYRYIVEKRNEFPDFYRGYTEIMKAFTYSQLSKGSISDDLCVLYDHFLKGKELASHVMTEVPEVIFKKKLVIRSAGDLIKDVIVDYSELNDEFCYELKNSESFIDVFMDDYRILFIDENGNRYIDKVAYDVYDLLDSASYLRECYKGCRRNKKVIMNRSERALKYQMIDDESIEVYKNVLALDTVNAQYKKTILKNLIDFYYDNYDGETLEKYLLQIDIRMTGYEERSNIIGYFIQRGLYTKAYNAILEYGYEGILDKRIQRLASRLIRERRYKKDRTLLELAYTAFSAGKYDDTILKYLVMFFNGTTKRLYEIWQAAVTFEVDATDLEERLIQEMLFSESILPEAGAVFNSYYSSKSSNSIVRAYLAYNAWNYLGESLKPDREVFRIMEIELPMMEEARDICCLAIIKNYAESDDFKPGYFGWLLKEVAAFVDKGILLPCFSRFAGCAEVPSELVQLQYVTYYGEPLGSVYIEYARGDSEDGNTSDDGRISHELMNHIAGGLYVKTFCLYEDEVMEYTIIDDSVKPGRVITEKISGKDQPQGGSGVIHGRRLINRMIEYLKAQDDMSVDEAIINYDKMDMMAETLFEL